MIVPLLAAAALAQSTTSAPEQTPAQIEAEYAAQRVARFGMKSALAEAGAGAEVYRVFFSNGYGAALPPIAFERRPGQPPKVVVYSTDGKMETPASASVWREIQDASQFADRDFAPLSPEKVSSEVVVCIHGTGVLIEIVNAPLGHDRTDVVRTARQHTCARGLTTQFGFKLAKHAVEQFPACAALKDDEHGNDLHRLTLCTRLSGDKIAASELANQIGSVSILREDLAPNDAWQFWMGGNARIELDWAGQITKDPQYGDKRAAKFLAAQSDLAYLSLFPSIIEGLTSQSIKVTGRIQRLTKSEPEIQESAEYVQIWIWDTAGQQWNVKSWTVAAFTAAR